MPTTADMFAASLNAALSANAQLAAQAPAARGLGDTALIDAQRAIADARRHLDACASVVAGEVVRRSSLEAGLTGLARKEGFRPPEALIQHSPGATSRDAATLVRAGTMINDAVALDAILDSEPDADGHDVPLVTMVEPWLARVGQAIAAEDDRRPRSEPSDRVAAEDHQQLVAEDDLPMLVHRADPVRIAVEGDPQWIGTARTGSRRRLPRAGGLRTAEVRRRGESG